MGALVSDPVVLVVAVQSHNLEEASATAIKSALGLEIVAVMQLTLVAVQVMQMVDPHFQQIACLSL